MMESRLVRTVIVSILLLAGARGQAAVSVSGIFTDHMVLQHQRVVPIWGEAEEGTVVTVRFNGQELNSTADAQWR